MLKLGIQLALVGALALVVGCSSLPRGASLQKVESHAFSPPGLGSGPEMAHLAPDQSAFSMLANGVDGLAARLELINSAQSSLDLQYYIFRSDVSGTLVAQALLLAADRGVRIRILVDDGESVMGDERLFALAAHQLIQIRVFNPFDYRGHNRSLRAVDFLLHKRRLDHRMHNKLIVADNDVAVLGGRNIGDQYFQIAPDSQFGDDDVVVKGPLVPQLSSVFDEFWNHPLSVPVAALEPKHTSGDELETFRRLAPAVRPTTLFDTDLAQRLSSGAPLAGLLDGRTHFSQAKANLVYDSPDKGMLLQSTAPSRAIYAEVEARAATVNTEILMITPYFVPSRRQLDLLKNLRERGVSVQALTNSLEAAPDVTAHAGYARNRPSLLETGVEIFEIRARVQGQKGTGQPTKLSRHGNYALHAKLYVFDRRSLFVGSMNFDQRSQHLNTEIGLVIDSPELSVSAARRFESLTQRSNAYSVKLRTDGSGSTDRLVWETENGGVIEAMSVEPARSRWQRFKMKLLEYVPLDNEL